MRILSIGFVAFCLWAWFASYIYVNKIYTTIPIPEALSSNPEVGNDTVNSDTLSIQASENQKMASEIAKEERAYFDFDQSVIKSKPDLENYLTRIKPYLERKTDLVLTIIGHTDAIGSETYNLKLGMKRANAVKVFLKDQGISTDRMEVASKGESQPTADNSTKEGRAQNRRAVITIN